MTNKRALPKTASKPVAKVLKTEKTPTRKSVPHKVSINAWNGSIVAERMRDGTTEYLVRWNLTWEKGARVLKSGMIRIAAGDEYPGRVVQRSGDQLLIEWTEKVWYKASAVPADVVGDWHAAQWRETKKTKETKKKEAGDDEDMEEEDTGEEDTEEMGDENIGGDQADPGVMQSTETNKHDRKSNKIATNKSAAEKENHVTADSSHLDFDGLKDLIVVCPGDSVSA